MRAALLSEVLQESRAGFWGADPGLGDVDVRVVRNGDIQDSGLRWDSLPLRSVSQSEAERASLRKDDILITTSGDCGYCAHIQFDPDQPTIASNFVRILRFDETRVVPRFIYHFIQSRAFRASLAPYIRGTALKNLSLATAAERIKVPLPAPQEQRRIAEILDKADALRAKRRAALAHLDTLSQSIFVDMFGDPATNPKGWPVSKLDELAVKITDGEHLNPEFSPSGMPIVMAGDVLDDGIDTKKAKAVEWDLGVRFRRKCDPQAGDLLLVSRGATIGRQCVVCTDDLFCLMGSVILIKPRRERVESAFLSAYLKQPIVRAALYNTSGASAQQAIYLKDLRNLRLILPPIDVQRQFTRLAGAVAEVKADGRSSLRDLDVLLFSLQHRAFRGEL